MNESLCGDGVVPRGTTLSKSWRGQSAKAVSECGFLGEMPEKGCPEGMATRGGRTLTSAGVDSGRKPQE